MAKFLEGNELNAELGKIFERAETSLILISPFIKLHDRYVSELREKIENHQLEIIIVFGKNEEDMRRSMSHENFEFFKQFPNIEIRYEKRLHAKYYANENSAILSSMNLYSFSQDNNIEVGVLVKTTVWDDLLKNIPGENNVDMQAWKYFEKVVYQSELLYRRVPQYDKAWLGLAKKYVGSIVEVDNLSDVFNERTKTDTKKRSRDGYERSYDAPVVMKPIVRMGYCIRTGRQIPFDANRPYCDEAFKSWASYGNEEYKEKYCHFSGELSNGETTKVKPILYKNWNEAKSVFNL